MNIVSGSLIIVDARQVFWSGEEVVGVEEIIIRSDEQSQYVKLEVRDGSEQQLTQMELAGIKVRRLK